MMYETGKGEMRNYEDAIQWFSKAANQGSAFAQVRLGSLYEHGLGTTKDLKMACHWYMMAAQKGNKRAQESLERLKYAMSSSDYEAATKELSESGTAHE